jgi:hypothetical protein
MERRSGEEQELDDLAKKLIIKGFKLVFVCLTYIFRNYSIQVLHLLVI